MRVCVYVCVRDCVCVPVFVCVCWCVCVCGVSAFVCVCKFVRCVFRMGGSGIMGLEGPEKQPVSAPHCEGSFCSDLTIARSAHVAPSPNVEA